MSVRTLRHFIRGRLIGTWTLFALALAMRMLVPAGFMPSFSSSGVEIVFCSGAGPMKMVMPGSAPGHAHDGQAPAKPDAPCGFSALGAPSLSGADPIQLAAAVATIMVAGLLPARGLPVRRVASLRALPRGPPASA